MEDSGGESLLRNPLLDTRAVLELTSYDDWWKNLDRKTRNVIRKSQRVDIKVKQVEPDETFWIGVSGIFNEAPTKRGKPNTHYGMTPDQSKALFEEYDQYENIYIGAYWMRKLIGFAHLLHNNEGWNISALQGYEDYFNKAPMDALVDEAVRILCANGVKRVTYARMQRNSLGDFKRSLGFREVKIMRNIPDLVKAVIR